MSTKLLALSCIAFQTGKYQEAGRLFAEAMNAEDAEHTLDVMLAQAGISYEQDEMQELFASVSSYESLSEIVKSVAEAMEDNDSVSIVLDEEDSDLDEDDVFDVSDDVEVSCSTDEIVEATPIENTQENSETSETAVETDTTVAEPVPLASTIDDMADMNTETSNTVSSFSSCLKFKG